VGEVLCLMWMMRWILLITIMLLERPGMMFGVTLERCNAMAVEEIQQSTKKATTKTAMAMEMGTVTYSNDNDVNANANDSASTTVTRTTRPGCASGW
jgi:hypothetical protein